MIMVDIEMPEKCCECPYFHAEYPLHCKLIKPPDKNKQLSAPYGLPRPDWCPLLQEAIPADTKMIGMLNGTDVEVFCCPNCRMVLNDSFHFCPNCGQAVKDVDLHRGDFVNRNEKTYVVSKKIFDVEGGFYTIILEEQNKETK